MNQPLQCANPGWCVGGWLPGPLLLQMQSGQGHIKAALSAAVGLALRTCAPIAGVDAVHTLRTAPLVSQPEQEPCTSGHWMLDQGLNSMFELTGLSLTTSGPVCEQHKVVARKLPRLMRAQMQQTFSSNPTLCHPTS